MTNQPFCVCAWRLQSPVTTDVGLRLFLSRPIPAVPQPRLLALSAAVPVRSLHFVYFRHFCDLHPIHKHLSIRLHPSRRVTIRGHFGYLFAVCHRACGALLYVCPCCTVRTPIDSIHIRHEAPDQRALLLSPVMDLEWSSRATVDRVLNQNCESLQDSRTVQVLPLQVPRTNAIDPLL